MYAMRLAWRVSAQGLTGCLPRESPNITPPAASSSRLSPLPR